VNISRGTEIALQNSPFFRIRWRDTFSFLILSDKPRKRRPGGKLSFQARDDNARLETMERIRANGVLPPILVRPRGLEGDEERSSGHRRKHACETIGFSTIPKMIRDLDDNAARIRMVDRNIQRKNILSTEQAYADSMRMEAIELLPDSGRSSLRFWETGNVDPVEEEIGQDDVKVSLTDKNGNFCAEFTENRTA